jgi:hypothetical protein
LLLELRQQRCEGICINITVVWSCCCTLLQALLQGPFVLQLQESLEGLPADVVQQLVSMVQQLAERIGEHGQQVRIR